VVFLLHDPRIRFVESVLKHRNVLSSHGSRILPVGIFGTLLPIIVGSLELTEYKIYELLSPVTSLGQTATSRVPPRTVYLNAMAGFLPFPLFERPLPFSRGASCVDDLLLLNRDIGHIRKVIQRAIVQLI